MISGERAVAEDLEGAESVVLVVIMATERWRNRLESELWRGIWNRNVIRNRKENKEEISPELLIRADVINLLGEEINTTKGNTEALLRVGSDFVLELRAGKTKCLTFSCRWNAGQSHKQRDTGLIFVYESNNWKLHSKGN